MPKWVPNPKFFTFDCYGTLVQWQRALATSIRAILMEHLEATGADETEVTGTVEALRTSSMEHQQQSPYRDYKTILNLSLAEVMVQKKLSLQPGDGEALLSYLRAIPPHPEVPVVLQRLRAQFRLAIISNTDDDLIAGTVAAIGAPIDFVITAQQARAYKPDHQLFLHAHAVLGVTPDQTVHVGMGQVTDLKVCHELGIRAVWINRIGETLNPDRTPQAVLPNLTGLSELLT